MNKQILNGIARGLIAAGGGYLINKGWATQDQIATLTQNVTAIGGIVAVCVPIIWSIIEKLRNKQTTV